MEQKTKFIIFGLVGIIIIVGVFLAQALSSKQMIQRERDDAKKENVSLGAKLEKLEKSLRDYENKISALSKEIEAVTRQKLDAEKRLEVANRDKDALIERLKSRQFEVAAITQEAAKPAAPVDTDAYWAGILKAKTDLELQLGSLRSELKSAQINNEQLQRQKNALELDINNLKNDSEDFRRQLVYSQKLMDGISQELVREKNDKRQIDTGSKSLRSENKALLRQVKILTERKSDLEKKLEELRGEKEEVSRKFSDMQAMLTRKASEAADLNEKIDSIKEGAQGSSQENSAPAEETVELPPIIVRPAQGEASLRKKPAEGAGKIIAVNKEANFVVIDLGQDSGIEVGDALSVSRNAEPIANLEVIQTRRNIAACDIKKETSPVRIGDIVR